MGDIMDSGLPRAVAIAWGMDAAPQRGPSRELSHEQIVAAAIEIADSRGLSAVTMQAVARSVGYTTMSLYRYVSGKTDLLHLMQDTALALPADVTLPDGWREGLREWAVLVRNAYRAHPWVTEIPAGQVSVMLPNTVRAADLGLGALAELEMSDEDKIGVILVLSQHASSTAVLERNLVSEGRVEVGEEGLALLGEAITAERFPYLAPLVESGNYVDSPDSSSEEDSEYVDPEFELGLELILDGLEALHRRTLAER